MDYFPTELIKYQPSGTVNRSYIDRFIIIFRSNCDLCSPPPFSHNDLSLCDLNDLLDVYYNESVTKYLTLYLLYDLMKIIRSFLYCDDCNKKENFYDTVNNKLNLHTIPNLSNIIMSYFKISLI
jgi:hypothetical protein